MSRYTGPTTRINRRFSQAIFAPTKAFERKPHLPGQHGPRLRRKLSDYAIGLNEKQKLRYMYGMTEKQFRLTFERAKSKRGVTGEIFLQMLECRLDNVVYRLGLAKSRAAARQFVGHGHIVVNGKKTDIASFSVKEGDEIEVRERTSSRQLATQSLEGSQARIVPEWLNLNTDSLKATVNRIPSVDETEQSINVQLIVEYYSR
ncbi:MAG: 30S ribosomal protein S4 [Puniceicoccaceae bacterium MED-G32]|jgi:small subunit ribosomal protein S4|nr:MAG: 30S ribosomal protein S4 [Puniceicoccaceae bacterium MED-G32]CAI8260087.1 MAG: 30S ribosomal protein S4 [Puniceicoccaceae bacterium MED-G32]|tara:strand:+ start:13103 stop:13711 length:609 start_codon:yes stop_codon:yes gene_type:complete